MQAPTSHGAIPKIRSPPQESVDKKQEGYDDLQPTKNKEYDLWGSHPTPHKDKVHSKHHKENQSVPTATEEVVMHKDRPPSERSRNAEGTNENTKQENREPKSASHKDRPHSERKPHGVVVHNELFVQSSSMDREPKPTPQKVRPHTERKHQTDNREDASPSPNDNEDKDSRHARHKAKHSGRKHHGDKRNDKVLSPKSSSTNVNRETTDPTSNSPKEKSPSERKQDSDALKSSQSNFSKEKRKNKPTSAYTSNKIDNGNHTDKYEGLPLAPNDNEKSKTKSISNKEREISDHRHKKIVCEPSCGKNPQSGKITKSNHDISLIFPEENGNKSVMRIVVRSFASSTKSQNCVDVKIEGEKFNCSNMKNPDIEKLIRELTKYVILIQKRLEREGDESDKAKNDQCKSVEVIELFRRPDKTFGKKEVDKPTKSRMELGISLKFIPSSTDKESKLTQETDKKQEQSKPSSTPERSNNNESALQTNGNGEVDKPSKRKKDKKESKPESCRHKKGQEREGAVVVEDGKEANEESSGQEDVCGKSKENAQGRNEKRDSLLESEMSEGVDVDSPDKKDTKKGGSKKYHGKKEVDEETNNIPQEGDENTESNPEVGQSEEDNLGVSKKKSKRKRRSGDSTIKENVGTKSENTSEGEDERRESNPDGGKLEEVGATHEEKRDTKNQGSDNIDPVNPKKPKTKCCTEATNKSTHKKDAIKKTSSSKEEGSQVPKATGVKQDSKKNVEKKLSIAGMKSSVSKMLVKLTTSKTVVAEGPTAVIRQKHKAREASEKGNETCKKKVRTKIGERLSSLKGVQIPVVFEELEPALQSKSSVKILLEHSTEEGNLCLNLVGIRNNDTQDFGGRIEFSQSGMYPKTKCEDVETMKELLTNCVKKVENVLNNLYQEPTDQHKQPQNRQLASKNKLQVSIEEPPEESKKIGGIITNANKRSDSNLELSPSKRRISFKEEPVELPFSGLTPDLEISEDECSGGPNGECDECGLDEEDAQYTREKDVSDILQAKLDAGEFDREARKSFQRDIFSSKLKDPDALERYKKQSHSTLSLNTDKEQADQASDVPEQMNKDPNQASDTPLNALYINNSNIENNEDENVNQSKTNLAISVSREDDKTTTMLGISMYPENKSPSEQFSNNKPDTNYPENESPPEQSSNNKPDTNEPSTDASSNDQSVYKGLSTSVYAMMTEPETSKSERNEESTDINAAPQSSIYETESPMVMVSSVTSRPIFKDTVVASSINQSITKEPSTDASSMNQATTNEPSTDPSSMNQPTTNEPSTDASTMNQSTTNEPSTYASTMNQFTTKGSSTDAYSINQLTTNEPSTDASSMRPSNSIDSMMIELQTTKSERSEEFTGIDPTAKNSIYETKSPMVMASSVTSRPIFTDSSGGEEMHSKKKGCCQLL